MTTFFLSELRFFNRWFDFSWKGTFFNDAGYKKHPKNEISRKYTVCQQREDAHAKFTLQYSTVMHWSVTKITLSKNVVDGFQGDEWLVSPFQGELVSKPTSFGSREVNNGKVFQEVFWRSNGKSPQPSNNVFFSYPLPSQRNRKARTTCLFLNLDSAQWMKRKRSREKKQIHDTGFLILCPPNGSSATIIFSRSYWYFTYSSKTFIAAERYLRLQIFFFLSFEFSKQRYHSQAFSTKTSGSINRFWQTSTGEE